MNSEVADIPQAPARTPEQQKAFVFMDDMATRFRNTTKFQALERQWRLNIAFLAGLQYHKTNANGNLYFNRSQGPRFKAYEIRNFVRPYADRRATSYAAFSPEYRVGPNRTDADDIQSAELCEIVLRHYWYKLNMDELWHDLCAWVVTTGNGFLQVLWDPEEGEFYPDDDTTGAAPKALYEGDLRTEVVPPFQIDVDPFASRWQDVRIIRKRTRRSLSWIRQKFPETGWFVRPGSDDVDANRIEDDLLNIVGPSGFYGGNQSADREGSVAMEEFWVKRCPEYPRGRLVIRANNVLLRDGDNPTPKGRLPFVHFRDLLVPGRLWGQSIIDCMIPMQRNYNRLASKVIEHIVLHVNTKVVTPSGASLIEGGFVSDMGEIVEYAGMQPPAYMNPPQLPPDIDNQMQVLKSDLDNATSEFGAARGQYQGKLSGRAIDLLIEQHLKNQVPTLKRYARGLEEFGSLMLAELQKNADDERTIRIIGKNKQFDIKPWKNTDLLGGSEVRIDADSYEPKSRTMALSIVQALAPMGFLNPNKPEDKALVFQLMQLRREDDLLEAKNVHMRAAELENSILAAGGTPPAPESYEDQDIHVEVIEQFMNSDLFKSWTPEQQAPTRMHRQGHLDLAKPMVGVTLPPQEPTGAEGPDTGGRSNVIQMPQGNAPGPQVGAY